jgi:hypothetical protein
MVLFIRSLSLHAPGCVVTLLLRVEIISRHHPKLTATLCHNHGQQTPRVGFSVIDEPRLALNVLFVNRNGIVDKSLLRLGSGALAGR